MLEYHNNQNDIRALLEHLNMDIILSKNRVYKGIIKNMFTLYWEIGNLILDKYDEGCGLEFISISANYLKLKFPGNISFTEKNLKNMASFAREYKSIDFIDKIASRVSWSCNLIMIDKIKNIDKRLDFIDKVLEEGLTTEEIINIIDLEYGIADEDKEEPGEDTCYEDLESIENKSIITEEENEDKHPELKENSKIDTNNSQFIQDINLPEDTTEDENVPKNYFYMLKDKYLLDFMEISDEVKELNFEGQFRKDVIEFFLDLKRGFALIGKEYHIKLYDADYYIDLLFYNLKLKCYLIVEFKIGKFKPEYLGILTFHLSIVDDSIRNKNDSPSVGIILCKDGEKLIVQYAFKEKEADGNGEYRLHGDIPEQFAGILPTVEEIGTGIKMKL